jgi:hypothetical protein
MQGIKAAPDPRTVDGTQFGCSEQTNALTGSVSLSIFKRRPYFYISHRDMLISNKLLTKSIVNSAIP